MTSEKKKGLKSYRAYGTKVFLQNIGLNYEKYNAKIINSTSSVRKNFDLLLLAL